MFLIAMRSKVTHYIAPTVSRDGVMYLFSMCASLYIYFSGAVLR